MKNVLGLLIVAGLANSTMASVVNTNVVASVTFTDKASIDAQGDVDNARDSWVSTYGGAITGVRVTGSLTEVNTATLANEAQVRLSAGAGSSFAAYNLQASAVGGFTGTIAIGPTVLNQASSLTNGGVVNFEWFETFQDGTAGLAESTWNTVTYDFVNGNFALGAVAGNGTPVVAAGSNVAGGLDFYTVSFPSGVFNVGDTSASLLVSPLAQPHMTRKSRFTMRQETWLQKMMTAPKAPVSTAASLSAQQIRSLVILLLASTA